VDLMEAPWAPSADYTNMAMHSDSERRVCLPSQSFLEAS